MSFGTSVAFPPRLPSQVQRKPRARGAEFEAQYEARIFKNVRARLADELGHYFSKHEVGVGHYMARALLQ